LRRFGDRLQVCGKAAGFGFGVALSEGLEVAPFDFDMVSRPSTPSFRFSRHRVKSFLKSACILRKAGVQ
jgi:hypothetical protein